MGDGPRDYSKVVAGRQYSDRLLALNELYQATEGGIPFVTPELQVIDSNKNEVISGRAAEFIRAFAGEASEELWVTVQLPCIP